MSVNEFVKLDLKFHFLLINKQTFVCKTAKTLTENFLRILLRSTTKAMSEVFFINVFFKRQFSRKITICVSLFFLALFFGNQIINYLIS